MGKRFLPGGPGVTHHFGAGAAVSSTAAHRQINV
jgi:hypothetical protein